MYDELIKALRNCACIRTDGSCANCGYRNSTECKWMMIRDAADAIERLVAEVDRKDKAIQGLLDVVDKKNVKIDQWKRAWKTAYTLYKEPKESKGEQDGERAEQDPKQDAE